MKIHGVPRIRLVVVDEDGYEEPGEHFAVQCPGCLCLVSDEAVIRHVRTQHPRLLEREEAESILRVLRRSMWFTGHGASEGDPSL